MFWENRKIYYFWTTLQHQKAAFDKLKTLRFFKSSAFVNNWDFVL